MTVSPENGDYPRPVTVDDRHSWSILVRRSREADLSERRSLTLEGR
jgi:hypothetical protein